MLALLFKVIPLIGINIIWFRSYNTTVSLTREMEDLTIAKIVCFLNLLVLILVTLFYNSKVSKFQFQLNYPGILVGGIDGISKWLIFLVNLIIPIVILDSWKTIKGDRQRFIIKV